MELLVIPVLLSLGGLLVFLGVGETPAVETIPGYAYFRRSGGGGTRTGIKQPIRAYTPPPATPPSAPKPVISETTFNDEDALLSDVLSEMMQLREELKDLREQVARLSRATGGEETPSRARFEY
jgi:hypothetical protein